jgi:hypothetical protein
MEVIAAIQAHGAVMETKFLAIRTFNRDFSARHRVLLSFHIAGNTRDFKRTVDECVGDSALSVPCHHCLGYERVSTVCELTGLSNKMVVSHGDPMSSCISPIWSW